MLFKAGKYKSSTRLVFQSKALIAQTKALIEKNFYVPYGKIKQLQTFLG